MGFMFEEILHQEMSRKWRFLETLMNQEGKIFRLVLCERSRTVRFENPEKPRFVNRFDDKFSTWSDEFEPGSIPNVPPNRFLERLT
jgi:hypothetical protein